MNSLFAALRRWWLGSSHPTANLAAVGSFIPRARVRSPFPPANLEEVAAHSPGLVASAIQPRVGVRPHSPTPTALRPAAAIAPDLTQPRWGWLPAWLRFPGWPRALGYPGLCAGIPSGFLRATLFTCLLLGTLSATHAAVPLPDHVLYGTLALNGRPVTKADTDVVLEARRSPTGPVLASYRMGTLARLGTFYYSLRLPVAAPDDATASQAVLGEPITVTVRSRSGIAFQVTHTVTEPGVALRLDFGAGVDTNGDGVPEGWELANLGTSGANLHRDSDGDGASDRSEFFAGTQPKDATDALRLALTHDGANLQVSFRALRATGVGFETRTRYYSLESTTDPAKGPWISVQNLSRITGNDQLVTYAEPAGTNAPAFFRARVWLE